MFTDRLWGGTLEALSLDVCTQTLSLSVCVRERGEPSRYEMRLSGLSQFHFFNAIEGRWNYAEITEFRLEKDGNAGQWAFDIMLWSEDAGLSGRCESITVNSVGLTDDFPLSGNPS